MLIGVGFSPASDFTLTEEPANESGHEFASLTYRDSSDRFAIRRSKNNYRAYLAEATIPGTNRYRQLTSSAGGTWDDIIDKLHGWAIDVKREAEAVDPWEQEAENMANDDSHFTIDELPKVDEAIEDSLEDLKQKALEHGKTAKQIQGQLDEMKLLLQKSARSSTKREWMSIFKSVIVDKLVDWGMATVLFQGVLHTLMASAQDIAQLAEHASRHLP